MSKPIIAIPIGDPAGIGPEIALKTLTLKDIYETCKPLLIGDVKVLQDMIKVCNLDLTINQIDDPKDGKYELNTVDVIHIDNIDMDKLEIGKVQAMCGQAAFDYIKKSIELAMNKQVDAVATTPINKESLKAANVPYIGHTEIFADLTGTEDPLTMFEVDELRVFFLSRHVSLRQALDLVKKDRIVDYVKRSNDALKRLGVTGRIAVAGLNPHSGENGLFGYEEVDEIVPAIKELTKEGIDVVGPVPADSVFALGLKGITLLFYLYTTTKVILRQKLMTSIVPFQLRMECQF